MRVELDDASLQGRAGAFVPFVVCRLSALPTQCVEPMRANACMAILDRLFDVECALRRDSAAVSDMLYRAVGSVTEIQSRRALVRLRRDLHNWRAPGDKDAVLIASHLTAGAAAELVQAYCSLIGDRYATIDALRKEYRREVASARRCLRALVAHKSVQKGLLLSSRALYKAQGRYREATAGALTARDERIERGLLRYVTRAAMKATPFSTFCNVLHGKIVAASSRDAAPQQSDYERHLALDGDLRLRSVVRLNKTLHGAILGVIQAHPTLRRELLLETNVTAHIVDDTLWFLAGHQGREVFQRVAVSPSLRIILDVLARNGRVTGAHLIEAVASEASAQASVDVIGRFVDRLIDVGLLRFCVGAFEQDADWDVPLLSLVDRLPGDDAHKLGSLVRTLRAHVSTYADAPLDARREMLADAHDLLSDTLLPADRRTEHRVWKVLPYYEDATSDATVRVCDDGEWRRIEAVLTRIVKLTRHISADRAAQINLRHFFDRHYGTTREAVPLLEFYEDYHREHQKAHLARQASAGRGAAADGAGYNFRNPFGLALIDTCADARARITRLIADKWADASDVSEIDISSDDIAAVVEDVPPLPEGAVSVSVFAEIVRRQDTHAPARLVISRGAYHTGYGKFFSRFLYMFPQHVATSLRAANQSLSPHWLAEIGGPFGLNCNLHPPLFEWQLAYPTAEPMATQHEISSSLITVERDPDDDNGLVLRHAESGKRVVPVDLGFLSLAERPPLFQLLVAFSPVANFRFAVPDAKPEQRTEATSTGVMTSVLGDIEDCMASSDTERGDRPPVSMSIDEASRPVALSRVQRRPRITVDGTVVIARQRWKASSACMPRRERDESDDAFFTRLNRWRSTHGLPREVFLKVFPTAGERRTARHDATTDTPPLSASPDSGAQASHALDKATLRNLLKPQYIDFANPLLVNLIGHLSTRVGDFVAVFEERYPTADDLPQHNGGAYAAEMVLQLSVGASTVEETAAPCE